MKLTIFCWLTIAYGGFLKPFTVQKGQVDIEIYPLAGVSEFNFCWGQKCGARMVFGAALAQKPTNAGDSSPPHTKLLAAIFRKVRVTCICCLCGANKMSLLKNEVPGSLPGSLSAARRVYHYKASPIQCYQKHTCTSLTFYTHLVLVGVRTRLLQVVH